MTASALFSHEGAGPGVVLFGWLHGIWTGFEEMSWSEILWSLSDLATDITALWPHDTSMDCRDVATTGNADRLGEPVWRPK